MSEFPIDWTTISIVALVIFLPILVVCCYLGYRNYLQFQHRKTNDDLIVRLAREGQTLTPELIDTIRQNEQGPTEDEKKMQLSNEAYQKLCTGGAMLIGSAIICLRNRFFGLVMFIIGLFIFAQGLALWLSSRHNS